MSAAQRECRAVDRAQNAALASRRPTWREHLEWLEFSLDSALRHGGVTVSL